MQQVDQLAKELAATLIQQGDPAEGLSDAQVEQFLAKFEQQVPEDLFRDPTRIASLLECSKDIARHIDEGVPAMPHYTITVGRDWKFSPPSIHAELPCHLSFKLHPFTGQLQIQVLDSGDNEVASSGPLRAGDCFSTTITEPGSYAFTSNTHSFMSGHLVAHPGTGSGSTGSAGGALEAEPSTDCVKGSPGQPQQPAQLLAADATAAAGGRTAAARKAAPAAAGRRSASPSKGGSTAAGDASSDRSDTPTAAQLDCTPAAALSAASAATHAAAVAVGGLGRAGRRSSCGSDAWDSLQQQPSEQAVLELVAAGAQPQHTHPAATADAAAARFAPAAELSRSGKWARRATAYGDERDAAFHQAPTAELRAGPGSLHQQQQQTAGALGKVRFAMGIEGLQFSYPAAATAAGADAAADGTAATELQGSGLARADSGGSLVLQGSCSSGHNPLCSEEEEEAATGSGAEGSGHLGGEYELLRSTSSQVSSDYEAEYTDEYEETLKQQRQGLSSEHSEEEDVRNEGARLLSAQAARSRCVGSTGARRGSSDSYSHSHSKATGGLQVRLAWQQDSSSEPEGLEARTPTSTQSDVESDASDAGGDMRLQRSAASNGRAAKPQQQPGSGSSSRRSVQQVDSSAQTSPLFAARGLCQPPGSSWMLGGSTHKAFSSTASGHTAVESFSARDGDSAVSPDAARSSSSSSSSRLAASAAALTAQAAAGEAAVAGLSRALASSTHSSATSTLLGPGTHRVGQRLPPISSSSSRGSAAAVTSSMQDAVAALGRAQQQVRPPGAVNGRLDGYEPLAGGSSDDEEGAAAHPPLQARLAAARREQLLQAAGARMGGEAPGAKGATLHSRNSSSGASSGAGSARLPATAAPAAAAKGTGVAATSSITSKKKKGKGKSAAAAAAEDKAAAEARSAMEARRRERDCVEFALLDSRGTSSRGDSEDEASARAKGASAAAKGPAAALSKCKFKGCKLTFASPLNQLRCQMSHLPSARTATAKAHKAYKSEVLSFFKSLPPVAVAKLLRLPEPAWLPQLGPSPAVPRSQQKQTSKLQAAAAEGNLAAASTVDAAVQAHKRLLALQSRPLAASWQAQQGQAGSDADRVGASQDSPAMISRLASLCLLGTAAHEAATAADEDADDECLPLLAPPGSTKQPPKQPSKQPQQQQPAAPSSSLPARPDAAAAAAAELGAACGACCSGRGAQEGHSASASAKASCCCRCHDAVSQLLQHLPGTDAVIDLLEQASEGTLLCNPRLLQQPHPSSCTCHACAGPRTLEQRAQAAGAAAGGAGAAAAGPQQGWSPEAVMASVVSGWDVLDVFGEHGVKDAALSYVVERRLITAYHQAKEAEARHIMSQLLDEGPTSTSSKSGSSKQPGPAAASKAAASAAPAAAAGPASAAAAAHASAAGAAAAAAAAAGAAAVKPGVVAKKGGKERKKPGRSNKAAAAATAAAAKKVPAWKAVSSDSEEDSSAGGTSSNDDEAVEVLVARATRHSNHSSSSRPGPRAVQAAPPAAKSAAASANSSRRLQQAAWGEGHVSDASLQGRLAAAEELLQARLLQQDQELRQLAARKQQQQQTQQTHAQQVQQPREQQQQAQQAQQPSKQQQQQQHKDKQGQQPSKQQPGSRAPLQQPQQQQPAQGQQLPGSNSHAKAAAVGKACSNSTARPAAAAPAAPALAVSAGPQQPQGGAAAAGKAAGAAGSGTGKAAGAARGSDAAVAAPPSAAVAPKATPSVVVKAVQQELAGQQQQQQQQVVCDAQPSRVAHPTPAASAPAPTGGGGQAAQLPSVAAPQQPGIAQQHTVPEHPQEPAAAAGASVAQQRQQQQQPAPAAATAVTATAAQGYPAAEPCSAAAATPAAGFGGVGQGFDGEGGPESALDAGYAQEGEEEEEEWYDEADDGGYYGEGNWQEDEQEQQEQQQGVHDAWLQPQSQQQREQQPEQQQRLCQPYQQLYYQQLKQQQATLLAEWPGQPGLPMHHYWLTGAHSRAAQDMLVVTGRAAAAAQGQEVLPFSGPELQQVLLWTTWYYQQALVSVAAMQAPVPQLQPHEAVPQQQLQGEGQPPQPAVSTPEAVPVQAASPPPAAAAPAAAAALGMPAGCSAAADAEAVQAAAAAGGSQGGSSVGDVQASPQQSSHHQHQQQQWAATEQQPASPAGHGQQQQLELQFGSLPADLQLLDTADASLYYQQQQQQQHHLAAQPQLPAGMHPPCAETAVPSPPPAQQQQQQPLPADASGFMQDMQAMVSRQGPARLRRQQQRQGHQQQQQQEEEAGASFRPGEAAELLNARWEAVVESCGHPQPSLQQAGVQPADRAQGSSHAATAEPAALCARAQQQQQEAAGGDAALDGGCQVTVRVHRAAHAHRKQHQQQHSHSHASHQGGANSAAAATAAEGAGRKQGASASAAGSGGVGRPRPEGPGSRHLNSSERHKGHAAHTAVWRAKQ